ncbi:nucleoside triphosphate pyrophosphohydrolase [Acetobacter conturbans]|uniref:Nucleoside triphosphate pyrophosphohydrolase n=1 Tax=Acetobacter conturbans TaxID=1737472 RepID=A0ABX0JZP8_9PROT|nr:nucleoside triphosphate pyrophosphohydrolase [Acetobacter conturbans]NHN88951.1 nucleoside triphosphate pyrophosphohydrolase [Acetobacter conturbans]
MSKSFPSETFMDASVASAGHELERLLQIMARLRDPETGCAWDVQQTPATVAPYAIEEAYEVSDAIDREAWGEVADELGDLLLQVVFQSRIAEESERFDFAGVTRRIADKMVRRHPHVFADAQDIREDRSALSAQWEQNKETERKARAEHGALAGIPLALPALLRARKLAARAARVGFDWPDVSGVVAKVHEEMAEVEAEIASGDRTALQDEIGDLLFSVASLARRLDLDPEACLRQANAKFTRRFEAVEDVLAENGQTPTDCDVEKLDALWRQVKAKEKS